VAAVQLGDRAKDSKPAPTKRRSRKATPTGDGSSRCRDGVDATSPARSAAKGEPARGKVGGVVEAKLAAMTSLGILFAAATGADWRFSASPASTERSAQGLSPNHMFMINRARSMPLATLAGMSGAYACLAAASILSALV
jgi:hypothetical protein